MTTKARNYLLIIAGIVLLVGIVAATGNGFLLLLMSAYVIPTLLFLYAIGRVLVAVVHWLER
jgi:hypothetical protein